MALDKSIYDRCKTRDKIPIDYAPARNPKMTIRQILAQGPNDRATFVNPSVAYPTEVRRLVRTYNELLCDIVSLEAHVKKMGHEAGPIMRLCAANAIVNTFAATEKKLGKFLEGCRALLASETRLSQEVTATLGYVEKQLSEAWVRCEAHGRTAAQKVRVESRPR